MNKALKWVLYILLGLVVLAVIASIVFAVFGGYRYAMMNPGIRMMQPYGFQRFGFSPLRAIFGGLLGLGVFILVIIGIVALVTALVRGNRPAVYAQPPQAAQPAAPVRTCPNCGKLAQEDWKTCPYCGTALT
jgi:hypothetical protein